MLSTKRPRLDTESDEGQQDESNSLALVPYTPNMDADPIIPSHLSGRINSLQLENFMCHKNLEIIFDKRITFITGRNGSGKSSIMAALMVALGGAANTTGRGAGVTEFIKKGATWCRVTIKLNNEGMNSYKKPIYGNEITIIRSITKNSSNYAVKAQSGQTTSRKKEEVDKIITILDLQIKNPICILTQDVARTFLSTADSHMRYSMFMKATHLESIKKIYTEAEDLLATSQVDLESKKATIVDAEREIAYLKGKLDKFASHETLADQKASLEKEYMWSKVIQEERETQDLMELKAELDSKYEDYVHEESQLESRINKTETNIRVIEGDLKDRDEERRAEKAKEDNLQEELQNYQCDINATQINLSHWNEVKGRNLREIDSIRGHLLREEAHNQVQSDTQTPQVEELQVELNSLLSVIDSKQEDNENAVETLFNHNANLESLNTDLEDLRTQKTILEVQLERMENENHLLKYGPYTQRLMELIDEAHQRNEFKVKPIGPCGLHVTFSGDFKYARAVESIISPLMNTYCVDNEADFVVLHGIMQRACMGNKCPQITITKFLNFRFDVEHNKAVLEGHKTVLDVLSFENDVVHNLFIDQASIETILLFDSDVDAAEHLSSAKKIPKNLKMGLTVRCDLYYPAPNYRTYAGNCSRHLRYFCNEAKAEEILGYLKAQIREKVLSIDRKTRRIEEVREKLTRIIEFKRRSEKNLLSLKQREKELRAKINQSTKQDNENPVLPTRAALEQELMTVQRRDDEVMGKIHEYDEVLKGLIEKEKETLEKIEQIKQKENDLMRLITTAEERLEECKTEMNQFKHQKACLREQIEVSRMDIHSTMDRITAKKMSLNEKIKSASEVHQERIETQRTPEEIQKLILKCDKQLEALGKQAVSKEAIETEYVMKLTKCEDIKKCVQRMEEIVASLAKLTEEKKAKFKVLQDEKANLVSSYFQSCLQLRGFDGQLKFDFEKQTLDLEVKPKSDQLSSKDIEPRKDTRTLSGGERSFSTVAFILAVWRAVKMPFYFLDEFDVFMDKLNRKATMDLLMEHAMNEESKQFVFITPQDISNITPSDCVSVYRMPDPKS